MRGEQVIMQENTFTKIKEGKLNNDQRVQCIYLKKLHSKVIFNFINNKKNYAININIKKSYSEITNSVL